MSRILVIGDIHGGLRALEQVLERANVLKTDTLIFLGDYVDGWSESADVIDFLINLEKNYQCVFIKGNHDVWLEQWLKNNLPNRTWLFHGGAATVESYFANENFDKEKHLQFLARMPFYHIDDLNNLFIHAGFTSMHGPEKEFHQSNYNWDRTLWETALSMDERIEKDSPLFPKRLRLYKEIFIGHTPTTNYKITEPMQGCNVWNVDTGAAFNGKLTIMDTETKEYWQSDTVRDLYPGENGRN